MDETSTSEFDYNRDRSQSRWELHPLIRASPVHFCEQVGEHDVWLTRDIVVYVTKKGSPRFDTYAHACLRFPRIEHKIRAMRMLLFGVSDT